MIQCVLGKIKINTGHIYMNSYNKFGDFGGINGVVYAPAFWYPEAACFSVPSASSEQRWWAFALIHTQVLTSKPLLLSVPHKNPWSHYIYSLVPHDLLLWRQLIASPSSSHSRTRFPYKSCFLRFQGIRSGCFVKHLSASQWLNRNW